MNKNIVDFQYSHLCVFNTGSLALWADYLPKTQEAGVQSQVASYQRLLKMLLDTSLLPTQKYKVRIKGKVEHYLAPYPTPRCSNYQKGSLLVSLDYGRQLYLSYNYKISFFSFAKIILKVFNSTRLFSAILTDK